MIVHLYFDTLNSIFCSWYFVLWQVIKHWLFCRLLLLIMSHIYILRIIELLLMDQLVYYNLNKVKFSLNLWLVIAQIEVDLMKVILQCNMIVFQPQSKLAGVTYIRIYLHMMMLCFWYLIFSIYPTFKHVRASVLCNYFNYLLRVDIRSKSSDNIIISGTYVRTVLFWYSLLYKLL